MMLEKLTNEEYSNLLSYGDPVQKEIVNDSAHVISDTDNNSQELIWISTLDSTTYPDMTFGYFETH